MSDLSLRITVNDGPTKEVAVEDGLVLGRSKNAGCTIADPYISSQHMRIARAGDQFLIEHMGGSNGTQVVEGPLLEKGDRHPLSVGIRLKLGETLVEVVGGGDGESTEQTLVAGSAGADFEKTAVGSIGPGTDDAGFDMEGTVVDAAWQKGAPPPPKETPKPAPAEASPPPAKAPPAPAKATPAPAKASAPPPPVAAPPLTDHGTKFQATVIGAAGQLSPLAIQAFMEKARPRLVFANEMMHEIVPIEFPEFTVGRNAKMNPNLLIDHATISGVHAKICLEGDRFFLIDHESTNHTYVFLGERKEQLGPHSPREIHSDTRIIFGGVEALFVTDIDSESRLIDRSPVQGALEHLVRQKRVTEAQRKQARSTAESEKRHAGEILIRDRIVTVEQWLGATELAGRQSFAEESVGGMRKAMVIMGVLVVILIGVAVFIMLNKK